MAKVLTRLLMGMIFVFVTISSPLHAHAITQAPASEATTHDMDVSAMDEDCAKAMAAAAAEESKTRDGGYKGDCCDVGCKCPLSHCPATPVGLVAEVSELIFPGKAITREPEEAILPAYLADTLKRPPRA